MFQSSWTRVNLLVFISLVFSLAIAYPVDAQYGIHSLARNILGVYAVLFPVGWLFLAFLFPEKRQMSLAARIALSIGLSAAVDSIGLMLAFYLLHASLTPSMNIALLLFAGIAFFGLYIFGERKRRKAA